MLNLYFMKLIDTIDHTTDSYVAHIPHMALYGNAVKMQLYIVYYVCCCSFAWDT